MIRVFFCGVLFTSVVGPVCATHITGRVVSIADGDTLTVLDVGKTQHKIRLSGIDAPEKSQAFGNVSRQHLAELCFQQQATVTVKTVDKYKRTVGDVECKGQDAGQLMVRDGMAWVYVQYAQGYSHLYPLQAQAKAARLGLWGDGVEPVAPWLYRRQPAQAATPKTNKNNDLDLNNTSQAAPVDSKAPTSSTCYTGPRGGTYTITASGRKNYGGC